MKTHHVYRAFDANGALLYVGVSVHVHNRLNVHRRERAWAIDIASWTSEPFQDRAEALAHESHLIRTLQPRWNRIIDRTSFVQVEPNTLSARPTEPVHAWDAEKFVRKQCGVRNIWRHVHRGELHYWRPHPVGKRYFEHADLVAFCEAHKATAISDAEAA